MNRCAAILLLCLLPSVAGAQVMHEHAGPGRQSSITDTGIAWPSRDQITRVLSMRDYNTRVVVLGVTALGMASGVIGTFLLLRKRSLTADALSHATLPGIALAFIIGTSFGFDGKALVGLLAGAFVLGVIGVGVILLIRNTTPLKDDAALGIVLSVFFGFGAALVKIAEQMPGGSAAGLDRFILGRAASMIASDAQAILIVSLLIALASVLLFKEMRLLCFDQNYARAQGWPVLLLDAILMGLVVAVTVIGLQAVGLVLVVAILIIPAAAARFWTHRLSTMTVLSALIGAASGYLGAIASALLSRLPTGPVIVLVCASIFLFSLIFGARRGVVVRVARHIRLSRRITMQHLLRAMFELAEEGGGPHGVRANELLVERSWSIVALRRHLSRALRRDLIRENADGSYSLTEQGRIEARRVVRNHRLWEMYLITHADIAPSHVDRDADRIEHVLEPLMIERLEQLVAENLAERDIPHSPHPLSTIGISGR